MSKIVQLRNGIACAVRKYRRARSLRITVHKDGSVLLTLPFFVSYSRGMAFLESKSEWIREKKEKYEMNPAYILFRGSKKEFQEKSAAALELVEQRLRLFQRLYGVDWKSLRIGNQKSRWGSCSQQGDLIFNYRLLFLPEHLRDYVVVHELCHLIEFNHSPKFWSHVERTFPDYRTLRKELRLL